MLEMPHAGKDHSGIGLVRRFNSLLVTFGTAGLDDRRYSSISGNLNTIRHGEEGIGCHHRTSGTFPGTFHRHETGIDP